MEDSTQPVVVPHDRIRLGGLEFAWRITHVFSLLPTGTNGGLTWLEPRPGLLVLGLWRLLNRDLRLLSKHEKTR